MERRLRDAALLNQMMNTRLCQFQEQADEDRTQCNEQLAAMAMDNHLLRSEMVVLSADLDQERSMSGNIMPAWPTTAGEEEERCEEEWVEESSEEGEEAYEYEEEVWVSPVSSLEDFNAVGAASLKGKICLSLEVEGSPFPSPESDSVYSDESTGSPAPQTPVRFARGVQEFILGTQDAIQVTVDRVGLCCHPFSVQYETRDGTAKSGLDYFRTAGFLRFETGETSQKISVEMLSDDSQKELHFFIDLFNASSRSVSSSDDDDHEDLEEPELTAVRVVLLPAPQAAS